MSAIILPFGRPVPAQPGISKIERARAAAWAAHLAATGGGTWWVESHIADDGEVWLGVVTPSSHGVTKDDLTLTWLASRTAAGIELMHMPSGKKRGTFPTVPEALAAIEGIEKGASITSRAG